MTQLTNRSHHCECAGAALKHGYGTLDVKTLDILEVEAAEKRQKKRKNRGKKNS